MSATALPLPVWIAPRRTAIARFTLLLFVWLLPFHSLAMAALVGSGAGFGRVRTVAAWKELAIALLLAWVAGRALLGRGPGVRVAMTDLLIGGLLGIATVFLLLENPLLRAGIPVGAELYGFRDTVFFMLLYYVGRGMPELAEETLVLRHLFLMAVVISIVGILERTFITPDMLVLLGVASYMNDFLSMSAFTEGNEWGLPQNYWSILGGVAVRRAGSVFLHSQGFALPFLLLMPAATVWTLSSGRRRPAVARVGYALLWAGLLVSITRMTIAVCLIQVALYYVMVRRPEWAIGSVVAALAAFGIAMAVVPGLTTFVWETLTWQTPSSASHAKDWSRGLVAYLEQPWGHGLGTSEHVAIRFGLPPVSADNLFLAYATQLGVLGLAAIISVLTAVLVTGWRVFRIAATDDHRLFGAAIALAALGVLLNGVTSLVFSSNLLAYLFFLLAGVAVTLSQSHRAAPRERPAR
ncbi:MAG TPA: O-antigen ligase family protein [Gemmatimonadaceae bacterium]|nr:O-antigen ligase family protein [Gemmatimonadaceae bacterium]